MENRPRGYHVVTVFANDSDTGRSGEVEYIIDDDSVSSYFIIDKLTGRIATAEVIDYEKLSQPSFVFTVIATDDGVTKKSSEATVNITIVDENDHCPVFKTAPGTYRIPLVIEAYDDDSGKNGQIEYQVDQDSDQGQNFYINRSSGELLVNEKLQPGAYPLTIIARDLADNPCLRNLVVTVIIDEDTVPKPIGITSMAFSHTISPIVVAPSTSRSITPRTSHPTAKTASPPTNSNFVESPTAKSIAPETYPTTSVIAVRATSTAAKTPINIYKPVSPTPSVVVPEWSSSATEVQSTSRSITPRTSHPTAKTASPPTNSNFVESPTAKSIAPETYPTTSVIAVRATSTAAKTPINIYKPVSPTPSVVVPERSSSATEVQKNFKTVTVALRLTNRNFVPSLQNQESAAYQSLRNELVHLLEPEFKKIKSFIKIAAVKFMKGSVIAELDVHFLDITTNVTSETLRQAVIIASDSKGSIGQLTFDIPFLTRSMSTTTPSPLDEDPLPIGIGVGIAIGVPLAAVIIVCVSV